MGSGAGRDHERERSQPVKESAGPKANGPLSIALKQRHRKCLEKTREFLLFEVDDQVPPLGRREGVGRPARSSW